jgi:outer membrane receptor protein involved in Fe transport
MKTKNIILAGLVALVAVATGGRAFAQSATTGAMQGVVTDSATGEAMPGVTVVATSPALQGTQTAITEGAGQYKITNLPPGIYIVTFYFADITVERKNVLVSVNKVTPVHVKFDTSKAGGEKIEITDRAPTIDTTSTNQGTTLDTDYLRNMPIPGRDFEATLGAAAGSQGDALGVSFSGSTSLENQYVVDGVNTTSLTYGQVGSPVINDFIKEIEIITGGYQAEYGRSTGGVVNVVTQSGTNEFHGSVFTQFTNDFLAIDPERVPVQNPIEPNRNTLYDLSFGATLGGPIIKDKLWFFVGFAPRLISVDNQRITKRMTDCRGRNPDGSLTPCDPAMYQDGQPDTDENGDFIYEDIPGGTKTLNSQQQEYQFVSKLNYAMSAEHQGQLTFSGQPYASDINGTFGLPSAANYKLTGISTDVAAKWTSKFNNNKTEVETVLGWHRSNFRADSSIEGAMDQPNQSLHFGHLGTWADLGYESAATNAYCDDGGPMDPYQFIDNCPDMGPGYRVGGLGFFVDDTEARYSARLGAIQRVKAVGDHEIKAGVDVEQNLLNRPRAITGDRSYRTLIGHDLFNVAPRISEIRWVRVAPRGDTSAEFDDDCGPDPTAENQNYRCDYLQGRTDVEGNTFNWAAYLRDSWQIMPNLTFNAGVRYEEQRLRYAEFIQGTIDPFTQQPRGTNAMTLQHMWAPRLGLVYDWTKEGRSKVYGSWGRYFESIPMDINDRSFGGETLLRRNWAFGQCGSNQMGFGAPNGENCGVANPEAPPANGYDLFGGGTLVAPGVKPQYMDEAIVGVDYEVLEDLRLGVSYKNRRMGRVLEDVSTDNAATYIIANPGEWSANEERALEEEIMSEDNPERRALLEENLIKFRGIRTFDKPKRDYHAVEFTATKRFSNNFFAQASYTYSRTLGNYPGLFSADNGQVDPNITSQFDLIELLANRDGPLPQDRPHYFKLDGYYTFDFKQAGKLTTGTRVRALSGIPINTLGSHYLYGFRESFLLPRGELGRTPWRSTFDLHLGYGRDLGRGMHVEVFTDLFNVFNLQETATVNQAYTFDDVNPVVGGNYEDLIWIKRQAAGGFESGDPAFRNPAYGSTVGKGAPLWLQLGARLTF